MKHCTSYVTECSSTLFNNKVRFTLFLNNIISVDNLDPLNFRCHNLKAATLLQRSLKDSDYQAHFTVVFNISHPYFHLIIIRDLDSCSRLFPSWLSNLAWIVWISIINLCNSEFEIHWRIFTSPLPERLKNLLMLPTDLTYCLFSLQKNRQWFQNHMD